MTLSVVADVDMWNEPPRVGLTVTSTLGGSAWVTVFRVHEDGSRWRVIMDRNARLAGGTVTVFDYHAPFGAAVTYEASTASESAVSGVAWVDSDVTWLMHASDPSRSLLVAYVPDDGFGDDDVKSDAGVFQIRGSDRPSVVWDDTVTVGSSVRVGFLPEQVTAALALLRSGGPLLFNAPTGWDVSWRWIQPTGTKVERNAGVVAAGGKAAYPYRYLSVSYTWVSQPFVNLTPQWSYNDLEAAWPTLNALEAGYSTLDRIITDSRG